MNARSTSMFLRTTLGFALLLELLAGTTPASAALRCYVKSDATGLNNGSSWTHAYTNLKSALGPSPCTEVWVAAGKYLPSGALADRTKSFNLKNGVSLYGGFVGTETMLNQRDPAANLTVLSGDIGSPGVTSDNSYHVVVGSNTNISARLEGFTIRDGNADAAAYPGNSGGGMYNNLGSPLLKNLVFSSNSASGGGGAMRNGGSSPTLINVTFVDNSTAGPGGGMYNVESNPILSNVTFQANAADSGGGINNQLGSPSLKNVTFSGNSANYGGAIYNNYYSNPSLMNVTISDNSALFEGGGIYNQDSSPIIKNSILYGNTGGELANYSSSPNVSYSIVQGGYAGTGNLDSDPLLFPLLDFGGFTKTRPLGVGSPAIDTGTSYGCPAKDQRGILRPQDGDGSGSAACDMGATESRRVTQSFRSTGMQDGWVLESTATSGAGESLNATGDSFFLGDDASNRQYRGLLSFNTASLPDLASIVSATLSIKTSGLVGTDPLTTHGVLLLDVRHGVFGADPDLQPIDFEAAATRAGIGPMLSGLQAGWFSAELGGANRIYVNKTGKTQFRLYFSTGDNGDMSADYRKFYSGDHAIIAYRPRLVLTYYQP